MTLIIVFALTAFLGGGHFWQQSLLGTLGLSKDTTGGFLHGMSWADSFMAYGAVVLIYNTVERYARETVPLDTSLTMAAAHAMSSRPDANVMKIPLKRCGATCLTLPSGF